jgi:hypothetical protein
MDSLHDLSIAPMDVTSIYAMTYFNKFVASSEENKDLISKVQAGLNQPTLEHVNIWDSAARPMFKLIEYVKDVDETNKEDVDKLFRKLSNHNEKLEKTNKVLGAQKDANCLPMGLILEIEDNWYQGNHEIVGDNVQKLTEQLGAIPSAKKALTAVESGKAPEVPRAEKVIQKSKPSKQSSPN